MEKSGFEDLVSNLVLKSESVQWFDAWCEIYFCSMIRCEHLWTEFRWINRRGVTLNKIWYPQRAHRQASLALYQKSRCVKSTTHLETPRRETMKWDEMRIHVSSCWVFGFAQLPYWDYCRYTRLIRPCIPLQGIASLHWVCQGVPNAPARWYTNSKRTIETHVLHAWRCTDVSDWNLYATWTSSR